MGRSAEMWQEQFDQELQMMEHDHHFMLMSALADAASRGVSDDSMNTLLRQCNVSSDELHDYLRGYK